MPGIIVPPALPGPSLSSDQTWSGTETFAGISVFAGPLKIGSGAPWYDVTAPPFNAKGDTKQVNDGAMTTGSAALTCSTSAPFTQADVGKLIQVTHALSGAVAPVQLYTIIASYQSPTQVTLAAPATAAGTGLTVVHPNGTQTDCVTTNNSAVINSATGNFSAAEVGHQVTVTAAMAPALNTTIASYQSPTQVTLATACSRTLSGEQVIWGTDDSAAFRLALAQAQSNPLAANRVTHVHAPEGWYFLRHFNSGNPGQLIYGNTLFTGAGWGTMIRMHGAAYSGGSVGFDDHGDLFAVNPWDGGTSDPSQNQKGIAIRDMHWQGSTVEDGFLQWRYLLSLNAASDVLVFNMKFSNFQGDCIYLGSGERYINIERHNQRIKIQNCLFDGINRDNRNALSVIDGEDVVVEGCSFVNCSRANMPGCIDWEPNGNTFSVVRAQRVNDCDFTNCGGNSGHVGLFMGIPQSSMTTSIQGITITNNVFRGAEGPQLGGFFTQTQYPDETTPRHDIVIAHNQYYDQGYVYELDGVKGVDIHNNTFTRCASSLIVGYDRKSLDVSVCDNN